MRRQISLKPETYPESVNVYVAGISGKVNAHYPGRSDGGVYFCAMDELGTHDATERASAGNSHPAARKKKLLA